MTSNLILPCDTADVSDGYHTFNELYNHRHLLWINLLHCNPTQAFKTRKDDNNKTMDGWFIAGMYTDYGQITYHLPDEYWPLLNVCEIEKNFDYDGHSSLDTLKRLELVAKNNGPRSRTD